MTTLVDMYFCTEFFLNYLLLVKTGLFKLIVYNEYMFTKHMWELNIVKLSLIFLCEAFNLISFYSEIFSPIKYFCALLSENATTWEYYSEGEDYSYMWHS